MAESDTPNYYELLCLDPQATKDDVKKAYRKQALLFHPDKMKPHMKEEASQHFQLISEAYDVLYDDEKRELYDRYGVAGVKAGGDPNPSPADAFFDVRAHSGPRHPAAGGGSGFGFDMPFFSAAHHQQFHGGSSSFSSSSTFPSRQESRRKRGGAQDRSHNGQEFDSRSVFGSNEDILKDIFARDQAFAGHHQRHMRNFENHIGSMFGSFGMFPPQQSMFGDGFGPAGFPGFDNHHQRHQQLHEQHQRQQQQQHAPRPTLFSTSPFANPAQSMSQEAGWTGSGTSANPFTDFGTGFGGSTTSSSSSFSSGMGGRGTRTSTRTTTVNGKRTTVTEVTDEQGRTTTTVDKSDGTRETFIDGQPVPTPAIDGSSQSYIDQGRTSSTVGRGGAEMQDNGSMQEPIYIVDDEDEVGGYDRPSRRINSHRDGRGSGSSSGSSRNQRGDDPRYSGFAYSSSSKGQHGRYSRQEPIVLDADDEDNDPNLYHPRMGQGQTLRGSSSPLRTRQPRD